MASDTKTVLRNLGLPVGLFALNTIALSTLLWIGGLPIATFAAGAAAFLTLAWAWRAWRYDRRQIARFLDACAFGDISQLFVPAKFEGADSTLPAALNRAMQRLAGQRTAIVKESRLNAAFLESTPVAILTIEPNQMVRLVNRAARKLLNMPSRLPLNDLAKFGDDFLRALRSDDRPTSAVITIALEDIAQSVLVTRSTLHDEGRLIRVIALQPIQSSLDQAEIANQRNLVRVLTHEIMNSITPVTSLARTSVGLLNRLDRRIDEIDRAATAIGTLADRAEGIMHFVNSYRMISAPLQADRRQFLVSEWAEDLSRLFAADPTFSAAQLDWSASPTSFRLNADPSLLTQLILNLFRNSAEAAGADARISLLVERLPTGRARLVVDDNGPGIPPAHREDVFLPFFSTKAGGSGVGLALARQIALAHGGGISVCTSPLGGASVVVIL